jgi:hypothetical protein
VAGREGKRGECQTRLGLVWRETGAVRNARPSRGQAASTRKRAQWDKLRSYLANDSGAGRVGGAFGRCIGRNRWKKGAHNSHGTTSQKKANHGFLGVRQSVIFANLS